MRWLGDALPVTRPFLDAFCCGLRALFLPHKPPLVPLLVEVPPSAPSMPAPSAWEPEGLNLSDVQEALACSPETIDGSQVRALMLEVIRRAAHDWVLYRTSTRLELRELAHDAYIWLFEEEPEGPRWALRCSEGKQLTSLHGICDVLEVDAEFVRNHVRHLTAKKIKTAGRPPERRKRSTDDVSYYNEHALTTAFEFPAEEES